MREAANENDKDERESGKYTSKKYIENKFNVKLLSFKSIYVFTKNVLKRKKGNKGKTNHPSLENITIYAFMRSVFIMIGVVLRKSYFCYYLT